MPDYIKDPDLNLYARADFAGISYSDGDEAERRMLGAVGAAQDRSVFSPELANAITDWPSEYHFSRQRHCLVRPLGVKTGENVLELGCGCGAITRHLGEVGAEVTAVEGSLMRARIAATRCADLPNVRIVAEDLTKLDLKETFDWVLLIGVLEYAPVFSDVPDPARHYLEHLARFLVPGGRLVVAIENKLGLKYFNGCGEDHLGTPFIGVQGLYGAKTPRTYGRKELKAILIQSGLAHVDFWYPFPDYKLPNVILSDAAFADPEFRPDEMLAKTYARDYAGRPERLFQEPLVARELARNGVIPDFANSFLVVASRQAPEMADDTLALSYAVGRLPPFVTETRLRRGKDGILVWKTPLFPELPHEYASDDGSLRQLFDTAPYVSGPLVLWRVTEARAKGGVISEIAAALMPWFDFLLKRSNCEPVSESRSLADFLIGGEYQDCTPFNLIERDGGFVFIDREWQFDGDVPLGWIVTRAVVHTLIGMPGGEASPIRPRDVIATLCASRGIVVHDTDIRQWLLVEKKHLLRVAGRDIFDIDLESGSNRTETFSSAAALAESNAKIDGLHAAVAEHERTKSKLQVKESQLASLRFDRDAAILEVSRLHAHLNELHSSISWRLTSPLRSIGAGLRWLQTLFPMARRISWDTISAQKARTERNPLAPQHRSLTISYMLEQLSKANPSLPSWLIGRFARSATKRDQDHTGTDQSRAQFIPSLDTRCDPHITVVSMARNEADRAEETMRHFCALFDRVIIVDHCSEDDTASIVARYDGHEGTEVILLRGEDKGYYQSEYMTALVRRLIGERRSDWVFFLDFDEYLPFRDLESFRQALVALADADVIHSHWINVARNDFSQGRLAGSTVQVGSTVSSYVKIALNLSQAISDSILVAQGNHSVYLNGSKLPYIGRRAFGLYHVPISDESAFRRKIAQGVEAYEATLGHDEAEGGHWKKMAEKIDILVADPELTREVAFRYGEPLSNVIEDVKAGRTTKAKRPLLLDFAQTTPASEIRFVPGNIPSFTLETIDRVLSERFPVLGREPSSALMEALAKAVYESLPEAKGQLKPRGRETRVQRAILAGSTELELIVPTVWFGHIPFLFSLMEAMRPRRYVELGTHAGGSFFAACQHIKTNYHYGEAVAIDLWQGDSHAGYYDESVFENFKHLLGIHFPKAGRYIRGHFDDAVSAFEPGSVDLLHIDGLHTYEAVRNDYETWRSRLAPNGTIIFHDTNEYQTNFGVWQFFEEIRNSASASFQFRHCHGLGVMAFGDPRTNPAIELIEYFRANAELVESHYATLGKALFRSAQYSLNNVK